MIRLVTILVYATNKVPRKPVIVDTIDAGITQSARCENIVKQSAGPIRWMPSGSAHRDLIDRKIIFAEDNSVIEVNGCSDSPYLRVNQLHADFTDPVIASLSRKFPYLRSLTEGGLWQGLACSITGQAVSLHSAAAFQRRLCELFSEPVLAWGRFFHALPSAEQVAESSVDLIRSIGVTTRRAEGLILVAREVADGMVPKYESTDAETWMREVVALPMVGPWTAASALLWGVGHEDVYPAGDVALLRASRLAYDNDGMTMNELNAIAENWRPQRAIATRLLWTNLLGTAWDD